MSEGDADKSDTVLKPHKSEKLFPKTERLVTAQVNKLLLRYLLAFGSIFGIGNLLALGGIYWAVSNTATEAAKSVARESATSAVSEIAKSQEVSQKSSEQAMAVFKSSSETFGRVSALKEMLDEVEVKKIVELRAKVNGIENELTKLNALLDQREASKQLQVLKAIESFKDDGFVVNTNARLAKIDGWLNHFHSEFGTDPNDGRISIIEEAVIQLWKLAVPTANPKSIPTFRPVPPQLHDWSLIIDTSKAGQSAPEKWNAFKLDTKE